MSAAQRQGARAVYVGQLGAGRFSEIARAILQSEGIEVMVTTRGDLDLGVCVVLVDATGERTFVTSPGAELSIRREDLEALTLVEGDVIYVSGYNVVYPQVATIVSEWLRTVPVEVVVAFDPGPRGADIDPGVLTTVMTRADWLLCNAAEAEVLSARADPVEAARDLQRRWGFARVVVRDGARGCVGATAQEVMRAPGFATDVVDTNGAGDVHNGVVIGELLNGAAPDEALLRANAAAAIAIASFGPATCPRRQEVDVMLAAQPRQVTRL